MILKAYVLIHGGLSIMEEARQGAHVPAGLVHQDQVQTWAQWVS